MSLRRTRLLSRLAFELTVVLVGVFLAIRLQSWADDRAQHRDALTTLGTLRVELEADREQLGSVADDQTAMAANYRRLADLLRDDPAAYPDEIDHLITDDLAPNRTWFPQSAAYGTLVTTGQIVALDDADLQAQLARLYERHYKRTVYNGELYDKAYLEEYRQAVTAHWDYGSGRLFSTRAADNRHLANVSLRLAIWSDGYLGVLAELAPQMDSTLVLVNEALAGR